MFLQAGPGANSSRWCLGNLHRVDGKLFFGRIFSSSGFVFGIFSGGGLVGSSATGALGLDV